MSGTDQDRERGVAALAADVASCRRCPRLVEWREEVAAHPRAAFRGEVYWGRGVPGWGDPRARLMVVGLAPAAHGANRTGRPFTGDRSGDWLYRALWRAGFANQGTSVGVDDGLELRDCWVTAPVKCAPPQNKPTPAESGACAPFLDRELLLLDRVTVFLALGGFGFEAMLRHFDIRPRPAFAHGREVPVPGGRTLVASYHVSQQNTFTGRLTEEMLDGVFSRARGLVVAGPVGGV